MSSKNKEVTDEIKKKVINIMNSSKDFDQTLKNLLDYVIKNFFPNVEFQFKIIDFAFKIYFDHVIKDYEKRLIYEIMIFKMRDTSLKIDDKTSWAKDFGQEHFKDSEEFLQFLAHAAPVFSAYESTVELNQRIADDK